MFTLLEPQFLIANLDPCISQHHCVDTGEMMSLREAEGLAHSKYDTGSLDCHSER